MCPVTWSILFKPQSDDMEFFRELLLFLRTRKKYWLIPLIVILLLIAGLVVLGSVSALAPFIYSLF